MKIVGLPSEADWRKGAHRTRQTRPRGVLYSHIWPLLATERCAMAPKRRGSFDPKSFLTRVGDGRRVGKYSKGQIVFSQGDASDAVFYVQEGQVRITVVSEQGKEAVVAILGTDDFFGEGCLAGQAQRISTAMAISDAIIARLEKSAIVKLIHDEPAFSEMFIAHLSVGPSVLKPISSISCSIRVRSVSPECSCCWRTSARKANPSR